jgi:hypothetical protein
LTGERRQGAPKGEPGAEKLLRKPSSRKSPDQTSFRRLLTEAGQPYAVWLDTGKTTSDGTPVRKLKWSAEIIPLLDDDTPTDGSA